MERHIFFRRKEIDSIQWKLTDKGTIKSTQASFGAAKKTLSVAEEHLAMEKLAMLF